MTCPVLPPLVPPVAQIISMESQAYMEYSGSFLATFPPSSLRIRPHTRDGLEGMLLTKLVMLL